LGDLRRLIVTDLRSKRGDHGHGKFHELCAALLVRLDSRDTLFAESVDDIGENPDRFEKIVRHHRHHHVELEISVGPGPGDCGVVAKNFGANHHHRFAHYRIDLTGHDRTSWLGRWQLNLAKAAARTAAQQPNIVRDLK